MRLVSIDEVTGELLLEGVDLLDGTAILDIKPHVPYADAPVGARVHT